MQQMDIFNSVHLISKSIIQLATFGINKFKTTEVKGADLSPIGACIYANNPTLKTFNLSKTLNYAAEFASFPYLLIMVLFVDCR